MKKTAKHSLAETRDRRPALLAKTREHLNGIIACMEEVVEYDKGWKTRWSFGRYIFGTARGLLVKLEALEALPEI